MEDRIYQDPFDLDFPDVQEDVELEEAGKKKKKKIKATPMQQRWFDNNRQAEVKLYTSAISEPEAKEHSKMFSKLWSTTAVIYCADPFAEKPKAEVKKFDTFYDAFKYGDSLAYKLQGSELLSKLEAAFGFGAKFPIYICIDRHSEVEGLELEVQQAFGEVGYQLQHSCTSLYGLIPDSWMTGVDMSGISPVACIYVGGNTVISRQPAKIESFDVDQVIADHHKSFGQEEEEEEISTDSTDTEVPEETPEVEEKSKTDRFETEEFKAELTELGFTDSQIESLYKSGALKALAAINLDDIEEGE